MVKLPRAREDAEDVDRNETPEEVRETWPGTSELNGSGLKV